MGKHSFGFWGSTFLFLIIGPVGATFAHAFEPLIDLNAIDESVNPCDDFYRYACGTWIKNFQLPADRAAYNRQIDGLTEDTINTLHTVLDQYSRGASTVPAHYAKALGDYYTSCMYTDGIEKNTPAFVQKKLAALDDIETADGLAKTVAALHSAGVSSLFSFGSAPDLADSSHVIGMLDQGGMSFSDRGYYFRTDNKSAEILQKFQEHVANIFVLAGEEASQAKEDAKTVLGFETKIAEKALALEDMQDITQLNHPMDLQGLTKLAPQFSWAVYFTALGLSVSSQNLAKMNVTNPDFYTALGNILAITKVSQIKTYLRWKVLHSYAGSLSKAYEDENFQFWGKYLSGRKELPPRWKECVGVVQGSMTEALGEAYVNDFKDPESVRARAEAMIKEIKDTFGTNLDSLDWLDDQTRAAAKLKLGKVSDKVGYPDHWRNYDALTVSANDFLFNVESASKFAVQWDLNKIGKPTDRSLWDMPPWEQNAYYNPPSNEMVFPFGALIPPIFDLSFSQGANYGSIGGGWMGHELTHGFDSDGRHFDGDGNVINWWTDQTSKEFDNRTQCLVDQGNQYEIIPKVFVNGRQTLTENLADQGGTKMGYIAYLKAVDGKTPAPNLGKFSERQQYWLAYAQSWCSKETDERIRLQVQTDVHPPAEFRCNAVLFNRPEFAADFGCKTGQRMAPEKRCSVW